MGAELVGVPTWVLDGKSTERGDDLAVRGFGRTVSARGSFTPRVNLATSTQTNKPIRGKDASLLAVGSTEVQGCREWYRHRKFVYQPVACLVPLAPAIEVRMGCQPLGELPEMMPPVNCICFGVQNIGMVGIIDCWRKQYGALFLLHVPNR